MSASMDTSDDTVMQIDSGADSNFSELTVGAVIGKGAFATVYKATTKNGLTVALKRIRIFEMLDAKHKDECLKEVRLLQQLNHPNIIKCLSSFIDSNQELNIVLELADSGDLSKLLGSLKSKKQRLPEIYVWKYFSQVTSALAYMHESRMMHRDIKPANVFITSGGLVKLGDLGLGRHFGQSSSENARSLLGTPYYMAPERVHEVDYSYSSDVWSAGCLLYEMVALRPAFHIDTNNLYLLQKKIASGKYPALPAETYSAALIELVGLCLRMSPETRPSMKDVNFAAQQAYTFMQARNKKAAPKDR